MTDDQQATLTAIGQTLLPDANRSVVAIEAPGDGEGFWVGAPSAVLDDGVIYLAYRVRHPIAMGRGQGVIIAKSTDGEHFETIRMINKEEMDAESLERPTLIHTPEGKWRLYLSCATAGTKHWRVELLEADHPSDFDPQQRSVVMPGNDKWAVKDTVITFREGRWHCWATMHPLDVPDQEDRMVSDYATSTDGKTWSWRGTALWPRADSWERRGARITAVHFADEGMVALYDGRASAAENYEERTGIAVGSDPGAFVPVGSMTQPYAASPKGKALRYIDVLPISDSQFRVYYEVARDDGAHELRTERRTY